MSIIKKRFNLICLIGIILLGYFLRNHNINTWPRLGATFDEYAWAWQGISLIQNKVPTSWSYHPQYKNRKLVIYQKTNFILVTPYLEHPPVFGLMAGSYALLNGAEGMFDLDIKDIRGLALFLGVGSVLLVYLLSKELYDQKVALISALLYATVPTVVIGSRIVQNENFFIPVWLASLYLVASYLKNKRIWMRNLAAVLCGLLILAKVPWVAAPFSIFIIFLYHRRYKDALITAAIVIPIFLTYFVYGFYYDKDVFLGLWGLQLNRYDISFSSVYALFQKPYLADRFFLDGWIYWGWFSFILLPLKEFKKHLFVISALISYFLVFIIAIPDEGGHGWYRYPFYPFLIISIALFIKEYLARNFLYTFLFLVIVGTGQLELTWKVTFGFSYPIFRLAIFSWGLVLIPLYLSNKKTLKMGKVVSYAWFFIFILMNIWAVMIYNEM